MAKQGIIDLGSNTIRLVIYEVTGKRITSASDFKILVNKKRMCGLSAYVENDVLTGAGIEKAMDVVNDHLAIAENLGCADVKVFATAVIRNRENSAQVVELLERKTKKRIHLISGPEESHLGFVGATLSTPIKDGLLIDIGGGSTELTLVRGGSDTYNSSLDVGCVTAFADCVALLIPEKKELKRILGAFDRKVDALEPLSGASAPVMYGIGGSARAVGKMRARMLGSDKALKVLTPDDVNAVFALAESDPSAFIHTAAKAVPDRMHTLLTGAAILRRAMQRFGAEELRICKYGIREGFLKERYS